MPLTMKSSYQMSNHLEFATANIHYLFYFMQLHDTKQLQSLNFKKYSIIIIIFNRNAKKILDPKIIHYCIKLLKINGS